jgi:hypothetical protein
VARPERPVQGHGPVADLARELRRIRSAAGLSYREMSPKAIFSRETLSAAARGDQCPGWDVTRAFADACDQTGTESRRLRQLWDKASKADRRRRPSPRRQVPPAARPGAARRDPASGAPRPDPDGSPADFVYQLRVLWEWAGKPGRAVTRQRGGPRLPSSTLDDALSLARTTLPPLRTVRLIVLACLDDEDAAAEWDSAWRAISVREFTAANPRPASAQQAGRNRAPLRIVASQ